MRDSLLYLLVLVSCLVSPLLGQEVVLGKRFIEDFSAAEITVDPDNIRNSKQIGIDEVIKSSDDFLKKAFGRDLKLTVLAVTFLNRSVKGGRAWCWSVSYIHPEAKDMEHIRVFRVYLTPGGVPLMKIESP